MDWVGEGAEVLEVSHRKEVADPYLAHQLMIGDFRIAMTRATRTRDIVSHGAQCRSIRQ
jgi:hypothetical protein